MKKLALIIILFFFASNIFSVQYSNGIMKDINSTELCHTLQAALKAEKNKDYKKSCELIKKALEIKSAPEFSVENNPHGPLAMQLNVRIAALMASGLCGKTDNPEIEKIVLTTLNKYNKAAKGKYWPIYKQLYGRLIQYYFVIKDFKKAEKQMDAMLDFSFELVDVHSFLYWGLLINLPANKAEEKINKYIKNGGVYDCSIVFMRIRYKNRDGENVFFDCIDFFNEYPTIAPINDINSALEFLRKSLDINNMEQVKEYYNTLNRLAFAQEDTEERMNLVSKILDARKKVEMIFPDVKKCNQNL